MRFVAPVVGGLATTAAAVYFVVYLARWEWNRALICGVLLIAAEVFLVGAVVLNRLSRLERRLGERDAAGPRDTEWGVTPPGGTGRAGSGPGVMGPGVMGPGAVGQGAVGPGVMGGDPAGLRERARAEADPGTAGFPWLGPDRHAVFIPVLLAAGVALGGLSWVVQRLARVTTGAAPRGRATGRLAVLMPPPPGGPVPRLEDRPAVPPARPARTVALACATVLVTVALAAGIDALADATRTPPPEPQAAAASTVVFRVDVTSGRDSERRAGADELWRDCRTSTAAHIEDAALTPLDAGTFAGVVRPALSSHDLLRLRGCLSDARLDHVRAEVVAVGQADHP